VFQRPCSVNVIQMFRFYRCFQLSFVVVGFILK
jgi:hypothetical protein